MSVFECIDFVSQCLRHRLSRTIGATPAEKQCDSRGYRRFARKSDLDPDDFSSNVMTVSPNKKGRREAGLFGLDRVRNQYFATTGPPQLKR